MIGRGMSIDAVDKTGREIHIGDWLKFDEGEWGGECVFQVRLEKGRIVHPGSTSDLANFCTVIASFRSEAPKVVRARCANCGGFQDKLGPSWCSAPQHKGTPKEESV